MTTNPTIVEKEPTEVDVEHLRLLALFFKIKGILSAILISFLLLHFTMFTALSLVPDSFFKGGKKDSQGTEITRNPNQRTQQELGTDAPPRIIFIILAILFGAIIVVGWTFGGLTIYAGNCIKHRKNHTFIMVISCINCLLIPYGTILGICSLLVISKPYIKQLFNKR